MHLFVFGPDGSSESYFARVEPLRESGRTSEAKAETGEDLSGALEASLRSARKRTIA